MIKKKIEKLIYNIKINSIYKKENIYILKLYKNTNEKQVMIKLIQGCITKIWIKKFIKDKIIYFIGNGRSNLLINLVNIINNIYSGTKMRVIGNVNFIKIMKKIKFNKYISYHRSNNLFYIIKRIKY